MSWGRRTTTALVLATAAPWFAACGGDPVEATPTPVVIPGSTVTIGTEATPLSTVEPSPSPTATPTQGEAVTVTDFLTRIGGAMAAYDAVHTTSGVGSVTEQESGYRFLDGGDDYVATFTDATDAAEVRRVGDVLYVQRESGGPWATYAAGSGTGDEGRMLDELVSTDFLGDLRAELDNARDFAAADEPGEVDGTAVESFTYAVDIEHVLPGAPAPGDPVGTFEVTFSIDAATGLPVRIDRVLPSNDDPIRVDFSGWGDPVAVEAPEVG